MESSFALTATILSSISLALMIAFDRLLVGDCYNNKPRQAWFVASASSSIFGLLLTTAIWLFSDTGLILQLFWSLIYPHGLLTILSGALAVQVLKHYFTTFIPKDKKSEINETTVAIWLTASPITIFLSIAFIQLLHLDYGVLAALEAANLSLEFAAAVLIATLGLFGFELVGKKTNGGGKQNRIGQLSLMLFFTTAYTVLLYAVLQSAITGSEAPETSVLTALMPLYWLGFAAGTRAMLRRDNRIDFLSILPRIQLFIIPIFITEIIGMGVFFFEFYGLGGIDPTLVNVIIGAHVLIVYMINQALRRITLYLNKTNKTEVWVCGVRLHRSVLPRPNNAHVLQELFWICIIIFGIILSTMLI